MTKNLPIYNTDHEEIDAGISQDLGYMKGSTIPNDDPTPTNPRDYADYVGARPY